MFIVSSEVKQLSLSSRGSSLPQQGKSLHNTLNALSITGVTLWTFQGVTPYFLFVVICFLALYSYLLLICYHLCFS